MADSAAQASDTQMDLPDPRNTRLIIVEGIMGSGKSTTGAFLESHLAEQGISARFLPEWVVPHPIRLDDSLPHPYAPWQDLTVDEYLDRSRAQWEAFVRKRVLEDTVTVLDGQLFHGDLTNLLMMGGNREQFDRHVAQITDLTATLCPRVIYLTPGDVSKRIDAVCQERGEDWKRRQIAWKTNSPYCQERGLSGYNGLVRLYQEYCSLTDSLFASLKMNKIMIDIHAGHWTVYREGIVFFLRIATTSKSESATGEARQIVVNS